MRFFYEKHPDEGFVIKDVMSRVYMIVSSDDATHAELERLVNVISGAYQNGYTDRDILERTKRCV